MARPFSHVYLMLPAHSQDSYVVTLSSSVEAGALLVCAGGGQETSSPGLL